tara:strand:- start:141 stop:905 length:765 start_codon:yes stop_codon:yes gene_type:complete
LDSLREETVIILDHFDDVQEPMQSTEKTYFLNTILAPILNLLSLKCELVGGMRRVQPGAKSTHHDIDVLITLSDEAAAIPNRPIFKPTLAMDTIVEMLSKGGHLIRDFNATEGGAIGNKTEAKRHPVKLLLVKNKKGKARRLDLFVCPVNHFHFGLLAWSGSTEMEKSWKGYVKKIYCGRPGAKDKEGRERAPDGQKLRWYLSSSRLSYVIKQPGIQILDQDVQYELQEGTLMSERAILQELGLPWLEPCQRCA